MEKENYLSVIRKSDFVDLFKFGWLNVGWAVPFDGDINAHQDDDLFDKLTSKMNMFDYSFEYLAIHFTGDCPTKIDVKDVQGIHAFDADAKREMELSFDPRIQMHVSPWADKISNLRKVQLIKQSLRGVDNLWAIFSLPVEDKEKCEAFITKEVIEEVFAELFDNRHPSGDLPLWVYLIRYERHSFYPKSMKGYFCDCIHAVCNWMKKEEIVEDVAESTEVYHALMSCERDEFAPLSKIVCNTALGTKTAEATKCKFVNAATLFLFLKEKYTDGLNHVEWDIIEYAKNVGGFEFSLASYMLGLTLGYDKTYDAYYDTVRLPIFKPIGNGIEENGKGDNIKEPIEEGTSKPVPTNGELFPPIFRMYKGKKGCKNYDCREIYTEEEREKLINLGYKQYKTKRKK